MVKIQTKSKEEKARVKHLGQVRRRDRKKLGQLTEKEIHFIAGKKERKKLAKEAANQTAKAGKKAVKRTLHAELRKRKDRERKKIQYHPQSIENKRLVLSKT